MKNSIKLSILILLTYQLAFTQKPAKAETAIITKQTVNFGIQINDFKLTPPTGMADILSVQLEVLKPKEVGESLKEITRDYYQTNNIIRYESYFRPVEKQMVTFKKNANGTFSLTIPPLEANNFYRLNVAYISDTDNMYSVFKLMHEEGRKNYEHVEKLWMKKLKNISSKNNDYNIFFTPTKEEYKTYREEIKTVNFDVLGTDKTEQRKLYDITLSIFPILKFDLPKFENVKNYAEYVRETEASPLGLRKFTDPNEPETFGTYYDFKNVYEFYVENLKVEFDKNLTGYNDANWLVPLVNQKIEEEKLRYEAGGDLEGDVTPNFLDTFKVIIQSDKHKLSTYTETFETGYKRRLVPDFGLVAFAPNSEGNIRGVPFVGVNISFAPVNKNVPLPLSKLTTMQRLSGHVGVSLNSLAEKNKREDFLKSNSLLLGMGYKAFTQATRINFGGILYQKLDPFNGDKSLGIFPYVGISIDLEIRAWLHGLAPSLTGNFKK